MRWRTGWNNKLSCLMCKWWMFDGVCLNPYARMFYDLFHMFVCVQQCTEHKNTVITCVYPVDII